MSLTNDHNAQNPDELQRILGEHPSSEHRTLVRHDRLLGVLLPFRAFGDIRFKWSAEMLNRVYETRTDILSAVSEAVRVLPPNYLTPPYLSAQPEVTRHEIRPKDKFLVLATDGLWEVMHRQTVVQLVGEQLTGQKTKSPVKWLNEPKERYMLRKFIESALNSNRKGACLTCQEQIFPISNQTVLVGNWSNFVM